MAKAIARAQPITVERFLSNYAHTSYGPGYGYILDLLHTKGALRVNMDGELELTDEGQRVASLNTKREVVYYHKENNIEYTQVYAT